MEGPAFKRHRSDAASPLPPQCCQVASFWYVRSNHDPVSLRLVMQGDDRLVSFTRRRLHGSWEYSENPNTFTVNFNSDPDKRPKAHTFVQIANTEIYRHVGHGAEWIVFLIYIPDESW